MREAVEVARSERDDVFAAARLGEEWAVAELFRSLHPQLLRYLSRQAPSVAEDLASETWLSAAQVLGQFDGTLSDFRAVLFTIARRRVVDHYRREGRRPRHTTLDDASGVPGGDDPAGAATDAISSDAAIAKLVEFLTPDQAEVILLRVVADLDAKEIAKVMGRSVGTVRVLQHRALRRLAEHFSS